MDNNDMEYRQGKSKKQIEDSHKILDIVIISTMIGYLGYALVNFIFSLVE